MWRKINVNREEKHHLTTEAAKKNNNIIYWNGAYEIVIKWQ